MIDRENVSVWYVLTQTYTEYSLKLLKIINLIYIALFLKKSQSALQNNNKTQQWQINENKGQYRKEERKYCI